ncbi:hypothetical protein DYB25_009219 [Aphanomyces astaci]|uniref:RNA helicase n=3 Tax=Aphanomyces astaci TaxID=112090 RepID=A0A397A6L0_APHAT|nr:hypothetical protein DYB25_009219 [Aphanomyces astaci]RHY46969.1 hypothetical protein DYB38_009392 [Aphanomyces astaci]
MDDLATAAADQDEGSSGLLSKELMEELGGDEGELLTVRKKKVKGQAKAPSAAVIQAATKLSKTKRKKLVQLEARKAKEARRDEVLQSLEAQKLPQAHLNLMYSTARLGHKETLKERLKRSVNQEKAGLTLTASAREELYPELRQPKATSEAAADGAAAATSEDDSMSIAPVNPMLTTSPDPIEIEKTPTQPTQGDSKSKKSRKKKSVLTAPASVTSAKVIATPSTPLSCTAAAPSTSANDGPSAPPPPATAAPSALSHVDNNEATSESAMMVKLLALRAKNEAKRLLKAQGGGPAPTAAADKYENLPKYTPNPVPLNKTHEMVALSKLVAPLQLQRKVTVTRVEAIQLGRMQLPVCNAEQEIMEAIELNSVVILCGETGSGKTTQVPQFLYEAGYGTDGMHPGMIGVTQPRRVAAVSTAQRVATELNVPFGKRGSVGYQIRYDNDHVGDSTRVKFMTDGILLKEIQQDFLLKKYSIILLDEAHERNVNTDILIGLLSRVAPFRAQMAIEENEHFESLSAAEKAAAPAPIQPLKLVC